MRNWVCDSSNDFFLCNTQLMMSTLTSLWQANGLTMMSEANDEQTTVSLRISHEFCSSVQQFHWSEATKTIVLFFSLSHTRLINYINADQPTREDCRETAGICWRSFWNISPPLNRCTNFCWHELDKSRGRRRRTVSLKKKKVMMVVLKVSVALFFWPKKISMHFNFPFPVLLLFYVL